MIPYRCFTRQLLGAVQGEPRGDGALPAGSLHRTIAQVGHACRSPSACAIVQERVERLAVVDQIISQQCSHKTSLGMASRPQGPRNPGSFPLRSDMPCVHTVAWMGPGPQDTR
jgi:hypothetical protein